MTPPRKSTATLDVTNNFFQRGKKSTIQQRIAAGKKAITPAAVPNIIKDDDETEEIESDPIDDADYSSDEAESQHSEQEEEGEQDHEDHSLLGDEIESDYGNDDDLAADLQKVEKTTQLKESISSLNKATKTAKTKPKGKVATYVAPYVGDIYVGFHQADIPEVEKSLRQFDLASKYGPCTDLTRLERWERAFELGLNPPQGVKDTLVAHMTLNTPIFEGRV